MSTIPAINVAPALETQRLRLRGLKASDLDAFQQMYSDPLVYSLLTGKPLSREDAWARMLRLAGLWELSGYGYWALEDKITGTLPGIAGYAEFHRTIEPNIVGKPEFGWALASSFHGKKLSTEAVAAIQAWGDEALDADETSCIIATKKRPFDPPRSQDRLQYCGRGSLQRCAAPGAATPAALSAC